MKNNTEIILNREVLKSIPTELLDILKNYDKKDILKNSKIQYNYLGNLYYSSDIAYTINEIWYSTSAYKLKMANNLYLKRHTQYGFTYNLETKKIKFWLGSSIYTCIDFFKHKYTFVDEVLLTKTTCEGLISGEIKNLFQLCERYIKANKLSCKPKNLYKCVKNECFNKSQFHLLLATTYNTQDEYY